MDDTQTVIRRVGRKKTFVRYVLSAKAGKDPRGDFIRDAKSDPDFIENEFPDEEALETFLELQGACSGAVEAGIMLFREWARYASAPPIRAERKRPTKSEQTAHALIMLERQLVTKWLRMKAEQAERANSHQVADAYMRAHDAIAQGMHAEWFKPKLPAPPLPDKD